MKQDNAVQLTLTYTGKKGRARTIKRHHITLPYIDLSLEESERLPKSCYSEDLHSEAKDFMLSTYNKIVAEQRDKALEVLHLDSKTISEAYLNLQPVHIENDSGFNIVSCSLFDSRRTIFKLV